MRVRTVCHQILGIALGGSVLLGTMHGQSFAGHVAQPGGRACLYGIEGSCKPQWSTWGHFQTQWRPWPEGESGPISPPQSYGTSPHRRPGGISIEIPPAEEEADRMPKTPGLPAPNLPNGAALGPSLGAPVGTEPNPFTDDQGQPQVDDAASQGDIRHRATMVRAMADRARDQAEESQITRPGNPYRRTVERDVAPAATRPPADLSHARDANPLRLAGAPVRLPIPERSRLSPVTAAPKLAAVPLPENRAPENRNPVTNATIQASAIEEAGTIVPASYPSTDMPAPKSMLPRNPLRR